MVLIKTGNEIEHEIYSASEARQSDYVEKLLKSRWVLLDDFNECLNLLEDALATACLDDKGEQFDSMALHSYADGIRYLAKQDRLVIVSDVGKRVIAKTIKEEV